MTKNQIEYGKLLETRRSNLRDEELTHARDTAAREARLIELGESQRHNRAQESAKLVELGEASRHNKATEALTGTQLDIQRGSLDETTRHNRQSELLSRQQISEASRHNKATESESARHNVATEQATVVDLQERARHNQVTEAETATHNRNVEGETKRHNLVGEVTDAGRLTLDTVTREQQIAETKRHNMAMELKDYSTKVTLSPTTNVTQPTSTPSSGGGSTDITQSPPKSENIGRFYYSRPDSKGKRTLMYAYDDGKGDSGWATVKEARDGSQYIITRKGRRITVG